VDNPKLPHRRPTHAPFTLVLLSFHRPKRARQRRPTSTAKRPDDGTSTLRRIEMRAATRDFLGSKAPRVVALWLLSPAQLRQASARARPRRGPSGCRDQALRSSRLASFPPWGESAGSDTGRSVSSRCRRQPEKSKPSARTSQEGGAADYTTISLALLPRRVGAGTLALIRSATQLRSRAD
jgi:hypothetical protein